VGILVWLIIVNIAVFVHEMAHYAAARAQGVAVKAFSIGLGPILWRREWRNTEWRVSLFPVGGYVDIDGLAPSEFDAQGRPIPPSHGFSQLGYWGKFAVLFAGPLSNVILAIVIVGFAFLGQGKSVTLERIQLGVQPASQAEKEGFRSNDFLLKINGKPVKDIETVRVDLQTNGKRTFTVERDNQILEITFDWSPTTFPGQTRPKFGVAIGRETRFEAISATEAFSQSASTLIGGIPQFLQAIVGGIFRTVTLQRDDNLQGPVGAVNATAQVAQQGFFPVLFLAGIINLSLGLFNLLPIPGLDGGRILLSSIVALRRKPFAPGQEEKINFAGFIFVMVFILLVTVQDITRLGT
jgi:regulator of sigma E protease